MDMYGKLSRTLIRRKYEKVGVSNGGYDQVKVKKPVSVRIPKAEKFREEDVDNPDPLPVLVPKRFTILSSSNDVIDEKWLEQALPRKLAEGRLNLLKPPPRDDE